jgi:hypothetical protein
MLGLLDFVPGDVTGRGADQHPCQQQFADFVEGNEPDACFSRWFIVIMEHFPQGQGSGSPLQVRPTLTTALNLLVAGADFPIKQSQAPLPVGHLL